VDKSEKILEVLTCITVIMIVVFMIVFGLAIKEMLNDYRCNNLPLTEFYRDKKCERYWDK